MHKAQNRAEAVALFRFGVIAPATSPHLSPAERGAIVRGLAEVAHRQPDGRETMISRPTLDRWIRAYRAQGLEGLKPVARSDTGALRRHPELFEEAAALRRELPSRSSEFIAERLSQTHGIAVSARTIRAQLASRGLSRRALMADPEVLGRYEAERVNQRWIGDFLVGPWVPYPKVARSRRAKLVLFVDDRSRLLVHGVWGFTETTRSAQLAFKAAILRRGVPESIYLDRGAAFIAAPLRRCAAVLGIQLIHSRPYRPQGRGKQERLNRYIRERFIAEAEATGIDDVDQLNELFLSWAELVCNTRVHAETKQMPIARFVAGGPPVFADADRLAEAFRWSETRMVSSTATVSLLGNRYQVDASLVGRRVELRFVPEDLIAVSVYLEGRPTGTAMPFVVSAHVHPQLPKPVTEGRASGTGIDYLNMVLAASEEAAPGRIDYRLLRRSEGDDGETAGGGR